jgi:hypothetical protein
MKKIQPPNMSVVTGGIGTKIVNAITGHNITIFNQSKVDIYVRISDNPNQYHITNGNFEISKEKLAGNFQREKHDVQAQKTSILSKRASKINLSTKICYITVARKSSQAGWYIYRINKQINSAYTWTFSDDLIDKPIGRVNDFWNIK